jgi:ubiquinone/menaquinone biosynthesis C-methylase UbiE
MGTASYDEIATWYEEEFLGGRPVELDTALGHALGELLGPGRGICVDVGCGTGAFGAAIAALGWTPIGFDVSSGMLDYARGRLPIARADVARLPLADRSAEAAVALMVHTDMPDYPAVLREVVRVLRPGGRFVHVGVHPCFCGGFADRSDHDAIVIRPGYVDSHWTTASYTTAGLRAKVGATHWPLSSLLDQFVRAGLRFEAFAEVGSPTPIALSIAASAPGAPIS